MQGQWNSELSNSQAVAGSVCWFISCLNPWSSIHPFVHACIYLSMHLFIHLSNTCKCKHVYMTTSVCFSSQQGLHQPGQALADFCNHDRCICYKFDRLHAVKHALQCACRHRITYLWWAPRRATYTSAHKPTTLNTCRPTKVTSCYHSRPYKAGLLRSSSIVTCLSSHRSKNFIVSFCIAALVI